MNKTNAIVNEIKKAMVGKDEVLMKVYLAILAGGHILLEDIPGVGKTTMALAFSKALNLNYSRVQFTPDVLPSDILGFSIFNKDTNKMEYKKGAVLTNLFLADELNRATSRTQSALLEAMEENQITVDGNTYKLPDPFFVIATQNPHGAAGTQLLPDSQMDRFMIKLSIGYPSKDSEVEMLRRINACNLLKQVGSVVNNEELFAMKNEVNEVFVADPLLDYIIQIVTMTRSNAMIRRGASPRASIAIAQMAKATAWVQGRDYIVPDDIRYTVNETLGHRIQLTPEGEDVGNGLNKILHEILLSVPQPPVNLTLKNK